MTNIHGPCGGQAIRTETIFVGLDMQLDLVTHQADADTGSHAPKANKAYSLLRSVRNGVE
ncbi:hypothetical protein QMZ05_20890 [Bradyrhizobium sp. INPA03-11B]|uniref:hypothetical protein n=1 Tax=Bradyrhizobium sp. INPA03-11B TaxID=418598 RepID=UPI00338EF972